MEEASLEKRILTDIQEDFPLEKRPYERLAKSFDITEESALRIVNQLRNDGTVRRIGATFNPARLGYVSTLAAVCVEDLSALDEVVAYINSFDEVTHNYLRNDRFNIWFTIIAASMARLQEIFACIHALPACRDALNLPATRLFKIRVNFDATSFDEGRTSTTSLSRDTTRLAYTPQDVPPEVLDDIDKAIIRACQGCIDESYHPFEQLAALAQTSEEHVLERLLCWKASGTMRRFGAVVRHRKMGITSNAMTVWDIAPEQVDKAGELMAAFDAVSHCYARPRTSAWPYNLYSMIHATTNEACYNTAYAIQQHLQAEGIDVPEPRLLFSSTEFKKQSMRYFEEPFHSLNQQEV